MTEHDALCPQRHQYRGHKSRCVCALLAAARADEREQVGRVWAKREDLLLADVIAGKETVNGARAALGYPPAHVEAVAEVICEDDLWRELLEAKLDRISLMWRAACKERDAARASADRLQAEHAAMRADAAAFKDERDAARAEVAALREQLEEMNQPLRKDDPLVKSIRREVLADLKARVEGLRDSKGRAGTPAGMLIWRHDVLALIDGAR